MSSKKDFGRKQQLLLKSTKYYDKNYFCDTLDEIMLVREAVEFNSSILLNQTMFVNFTWCSWFDVKLDVFAKCFYTSVPGL